MTRELAEIIRTKLLGVHPDDQGVQLEDNDWRVILAALSTTTDRRPWCETCGKDVHEILCPTCAKWWNDNPPPNDALREDLIRADYEWHGPFGKEKHRIIPPALFDRILSALEGDRP